MKLDDIDRVLSAEVRIVPSSGFVESVMEAIQAEAERPQPIPFPWKRAIPGMLALAAVMILLVEEFKAHIQIYMPPDAAAAASRLAWECFAAMKPAWDAGANWELLALSLSLGSLAFTRRLMSR